MEIGISLERALALAGTLSFTRSTETTPLSELTGRILASPLSSKVDDPAFDNSAMDGWAVRAEDCTSKDTTLEIVGTSRAGSNQLPEVSAGQASRIMTGAPLPPGADAIVMVEESSEEGNQVKILGPARPGYIRKQGENLQKGQQILPAGTLIGPAETSLIATMGHPEAETIARPTIAVISTGDELVQPGADLSAGQIYESNSYGLASLVEKMGASAKRFDVVHDNIEGLRATLDEAADSCDAILTSGGVSMGKWDLVRRLMEDEGETLFWKVLIRPGGPPLCGSWKDTPLFGLPGNPVSSHVVFLSLVAPWLARCMGADSELGPRLADRVRVRLSEDIKGPRKLCMRRIRIEAGEDGLVATTTLTKAGQIHSMVAHNGRLTSTDTDGKAGQIIEPWCR
ncbi:MAG: molybdopterin molybdenumtransferase MoeA [Candidatus Poseidoniales archaeon]|nr:MAG: molybdopterin molybdenumtransferase MoeA [Candidatus Poseidoniales archaeon]